MIAAHKIRFLERAFVWGVRRTMRRRFYGVFLRGREALRRAAASPRPLVLCANHSNWWDGFAAALLIPFFPAKRLFMVQSDALLAEYRPLRWLGAFGIDIHGSPLAGLRYGLELLADPRNAIWIFPQGVLLPQGTPIEARPGALWLARKSGALVVPIAFRYEWMIESRPSLFIHCGEPIDPIEPIAPGLDDRALAVALQRLYDEIGPMATPVDWSQWEPLFPPRMSINKRWRRCLERGRFNPRNE